MTSSTCGKIGVFLVSAGLNFDLSEFEMNISRFVIKRNILPLLWLLDMSHICAFLWTSERCVSSVRLGQTSLFLSFDFSLWNIMIETTWRSRQCSERWQVLEELLLLESCFLLKTLRGRTTKQSYSILLVSDLISNHLLVLNFDVWCWRKTLVDSFFALFDDFCLFEQLVIHVIAVSFTW